MVILLIFMGTSFLKPGIDKTNVNPPMFTHYNIVPVYGTEDTGSGDVDATPNIEDDKITNQGSGIMGDTEEGAGETIIDEPVIDNSNESTTEGGTVNNNTSDSNENNSNTNGSNTDNGTMNNNTNGAEEEAITPSAGWID